MALMTSMPESTPKPIRATLPAIKPAPSRSLRIFHAKALFLAHLIAAYITYEAVGEIVPAQLDSLTMS